ncbi:hypothetical protein OGAPHI_007068 [Ogataea philodendri]|uniref:Uncharacterized protein n=1 Tax=Ogataea philodendri TaxID=1378263 RepID=A0A9P8NVN3_9ASCO|nr:uncharacterized protein OGAPHI_007068 [Ogataea philodendri]KAH3660482.1 hypothetical protein OGAPHI_007068 [Ogataea philodendri]
MFWWVRQGEILEHFSPRSANSLSSSDLESFKSNNSFLRFWLRDSASLKESLISLISIESWLISLLEELKLFIPPVVTPPEISEDRRSEASDALAFDVPVASVLKSSDGFTPTWSCSTFSETAGFLSSALSSMLSICISCSCVSDDLT